MFLKEALEKLGNDIQVNAERIDKVENLKPGHTLCPNPNPLANPAPKTKRSKRRSAYLEKPRLLVIGDPTVHNVDYAAIEKATNTRITTKEATFVHKNADNVTSAALEKANPEDMFTHLFLGFPTIDLSKPSEEIIKNSCKDIFEVAQKAITAVPTLEKVVIMEPISDTVGADPEGLEEKLVEFANKSLGQLVQNKTTSRIIQIGKHDQKFGKTAYTSSILNIINTAVSATSSTSSSPSIAATSSSYHLTCPQAQYQERQRRMNLNQPRNSMFYSVPVSNTFNILGN